MMSGSLHVPPPSPELQRLSPLIGRWITEEQTRDSVLGPGVPVQSLEDFSWLEGGYFLVSTYRTTFGDEPIQTGVMYWYFDEARRRFCTIFFSNNGSFSEAGNRYEGVVDGNTLTFEGPARFRYRLDDNRKILVHADGTIAVDWWLRDESGAWQPWMRNTFCRTTVAVPSEAAGQGR